MKMINEASRTFLLPNMSEKEPAGYEMSAAARLNRAYIKIVVSKGAPISCVRKIKNELLELPRPKIAITVRYFQYPLGNWRRFISIFDFAVTAARRSVTSRTMTKASKPGMSDRQKIVRIPTRNEYRRKI